MPTCTTPVRLPEHGTFWEVLNHLGRCWRGRGGLMVGEEGMLWGAIFLDHLRSPNAQPARLA